MAEGFARFHAGGGWTVMSAGSKPIGYVHPRAIELMREKGIDISNQASSSIYGLAHKSFDYVVSMGCEANCPRIPAARRVDWDFPDPKNMPLDALRALRDRMEELIVKLLKSAQTGGKN
ncbi:MAG: hypothetical protein A3G41_07975 [Elusimicrobia bacterium RIFCSPLOWO2_12_FULL_59_9]|nr:MAG: hypothetical protein A3G41_07975 [Elusimicrobia bacterium RIFCSPLOWO2_12_FULL_59_9]